MEEMIRISVRELVAFSYFTADIMPAADPEVMQTGAKAHRIKQAKFEGETERSVKQIFEFNELKIQVYGRIDAFIDGEIPFIEEIKLCSDIPSEAKPEHRAQAICYASMIAQERNVPTIHISICYVDAMGNALCNFDEEISAEKIAFEMECLLEPYVIFAQREVKHRRQRNESLKQLSFPFENYRKGQRELAVQVYTSISRRKRLFASLPTGTGKSAAVLYPALKAVGEGLSERVVYLTARNTARQSPLNALKRMAEAGMRARACVLTARDKLCPVPARCHPDECERAKGHFVRQGQAIDDLLASGEFVWDDDVIVRMAEKHQICPFEFALSLCEIADVILMDLNYAFDPFAQLKRLFQKSKNFTLLVDEAHHTVERVRESLSGAIDSGELANIRLEYGKAHGRKNMLYRSLTNLIHEMRALECDDETRLEKEPPQIIENVQAVLAAAMDALGHTSVNLQGLIDMCMAYGYAHEHMDADYAVLVEKRGKERMLTLFCLLPGKTIGNITKKLRGVVFFSATLQPLEAMKKLLGGEEEDACFALPSPFPAERLRVVRQRINTRYENRESSAMQLAKCIHDVMRLHRGNTIVFFPSYTYLNQVAGYLDSQRLPEIWVQKREMGEEERQAFLSCFENTSKPHLALCVLGGLFSEGIDLPGERLVNVIVVGVGLPVPSAKLTAIKNCYQQHFGDGFGFACRIPGMQKVLQAAGRVIRSETDKGIVVLADDRFFTAEYAQLLPNEWLIANETVEQAAAKLEEVT